jgi:hypothetical protein
MSFLSGVKTQPPKNPFKNLAKISSSERLPIWLFDKWIKRLSATATWFRGLMVLRIEVESEEVGDRVSDFCMVRVVDADKG